MGSSTSSQNSAGFFFFLVRWPDIASRLDANELTRNLLLGNVLGAGASLVLQSNS